MPEHSGFDLSLPAVPEEYSDAIAEKLGEISVNHAKILNHILEGKKNGIYR